MDITKEINILLNSLEMYKQTREEMIKNHSDYSKIDLVNKEISAIEESIKELSTKLCDDNKQCTCDGIKEGCSSEKCKSRYYYNDLKTALDSNVNEKVTSGNFNGLLIPCDNNANNMLEDLSLYDLIKCNRFLVHFREDYGIKPTMIDGVYYGEKDGEMSITIREFCNDNFILPLALREIVNEKSQQFNVSIDILSSGNKVLYTKKYINCQIKNVIEPPMTYTYDDYNRYTVVLSYSRCDIVPTKDDWRKVTRNEASYTKKQFKEYQENVFKNAKKIF